MTIAFSRISHWFVGFGAFALLVGSAGTAQAALKFDVTFGGDAPVSGWTAINFDKYDSSATATTDGVTVNLTSDITDGSGAGRGRSEAQIPDPLLRDLVLGGTGSTTAPTGNSLTFTFTGLEPGAYKFIVYSTDYIGNTRGAVSDYYQDGGSTSFLSVTISDNINDPDAAKYEANLTPITGSTLTLTAKVISPSTSYDQYYAVVNAFELTAVPEPASVALMGLGALILLPWRRRA